MPDLIFEGSYKKHWGKDYFVDCRNQFYGIITENTIFIKDKQINVSYETVLKGIKKDTPVLATFSYTQSNDEVNWIKPYPVSYPYGMQEVISVFIIGMEMEEGMMYYEKEYENI